MAARLRQCLSFVWRLEARLKGVELGGKVELVGRPIISSVKGARIVLANGVSIRSATRSSPLGCFQPCVLRAMAPGAKLVLGPSVGLSGAVICAAVSIEVGEGTIFGSGAMVHDNDFHAAEGTWGWSDAPQLSGAGARPVRIGRGVFVGACAIILKGVTVGDRAVIGAGAVVSKDVPERNLAVGNPARNVAPSQHP
jgi:acetyltransferase-like isoleucine patch superfamily enzyme